MGNFIKYYLKDYTGKKSEHSIEEIKKLFRDYGPGKVDLTLGEDGIAFLALNNCDKRNAMTGKMMAEFSDAVTKLELWKDGKGVLIHGNGLGFCSGGDITLIKVASSPTLGYDMSLILTDALDRLRALPIVSVVYIHGFGAIGGGSEIAMGADFRVISPGSRIGFVHSKMGLTPAWGGASRLLQMVGRETALELLLTGRLVSSEEARNLGLVSLLGDLNAAEAFLRSLTVTSPVVIRGIKAALSGNEGEVFISLFGGEDNKKAIDARVKHT